MAFLHPIGPHRVTVFIRRRTFAEITRAGDIARAGLGQLAFDVPRAWSGLLLRERHSQYSGRRNEGEYKVHCRTCDNDPVACQVSKSNRGLWWGGPPWSAADALVGLLRDDARHLKQARE